MFQIFYQVNEDLFKDTFSDINFESILSESIPKMESLLKIKEKHFSIILTDDEFIKSINNMYRNKNYPTDVISFPSGDDSIELVDNENDLGELYISIETAIRQAAAFNVAVENELKRLIVHGILHLMGFDHERSAKDEALMTEQENFVLERV